MEEIGPSESRSLVALEEYALLGMPPSKSL
jgi:hypothetical protein